MDKRQAWDKIPELLNKLLANPSNPQNVQNLVNELNVFKPDEAEQKEQTEEVIEMSLVDALGMVIEAAEGWLFHECMDTPEDLAALEIVKEHKDDLDGASRQ